MEIFGLAELNVFTPSTHPPPFFSSALHVLAVVWTRGNGLGVPDLEVDSHMGSGLWKWGRSTPMLAIWGDGFRAPFAGLRRVFTV